jgi:hypothetical protein
VYSVLQYSFHFPAEAAIVSSAPRSNFGTFNLAKDKAPVHVQAPHCNHMQECKEWLCNKLAPSS